MITWDQGIVLQNRSEVQCMSVCNHRSTILIGSEDLLSEFVEAEPVGSNDLELAVLWATKRNIPQSHHDIIGCNRLNGGR